MSAILVLIVIALTALIAVLLLAEVIPTISGAPFMRTKRSARRTMFALVKLKPGERVVDLGSGDGTLVLEAAKLGAQVTGYEINPFLVWLSRQRIRKQGLSDKARVKRQSLWRVDLSSVDIVFVFGISKMMKKLESKLQAELPAGARVVSFAFKFPNWPIAKQLGNVYLYRKIT